MAGSGAASLIGGMSCFRTSDANATSGNVIGRIGGPGKAGMTEFVESRTGALPKYRKQPYAATAFDRAPDMSGNSRAFFHIPKYR